MVNLGDVVFVIGPILAFPVFLLVFVSLRMAAIGLTTYFAANWIYDIVRSCPHCAFDPVPSLGRWLVLIAFLLVDIAWLVERFAQRH